MSFPFADRVGPRSPTPILQGRESAFVGDGSQVYTFESGQVCPGCDSGYYPPIEIRTVKHAFHDDVNPLHLPKYKDKRDWDKLPSEDGNTFIFFTTWRNVLIPSKKKLPPPRHTVAGFRSHVSFRCHECGEWSVLSFYGANNTSCNCPPGLVSFHPDGMLEVVESDEKHQTKSHVFWSHYHERVGLAKSPEISP